MKRRVNKIKIVKNRVNKRKVVKKRMRKRKSDKKKLTENLRKNERDIEINERETKREELNDVRKIERKTNFYAKASEVKRALFLNKPMIVLLYKKTLFNTNQPDNSLPSSIVSLLQEFEDVFPEEIPKGLPPIRGIEHQIDFVLGATILNRPAYKSNLEDTKELQKQVGELMEKGYVRESMSPWSRSGDFGS